jgi:hypothetical protein
MARKMTVSQIRKMVETELEHLEKTIPVFREGVENPQVRELLIKAQARRDAMQDVLVSLNTGVDYISMKR